MKKKQLHIFNTSHQDKKTHKLRVSTITDRHLQKRRSRYVWLRALVFGLAALTLTCDDEQLPIDDLSYARSEIAVAEKFQASKYAPKKFEEACTHLIRAHEIIETGDVQALEDKRFETVSQKAAKLAQTSKELAHEALCEAVVKQCNDLSVEINAYIAAIQKHRGRNLIESEIQSIVNEALDAQKKLEAKQCVSAIVSMRTTAADAKGLDLLANTRLAEEARKREPIIAIQIESEAKQRAQSIIDMKKLLISSISPQELKKRALMAAKPEETEIAETLEIPINFPSFKVQEESSEKNLFDPYWYWGIAGGFFFFLFFFIRRRRKDEKKNIHVKNSIPIEELMIVETSDINREIESDLNDTLNTKTVKSKTPRKKQSSKTIKKDRNKLA